MHLPADMMPGMPIRDVFFQVWDVCKEPDLSNIRKVLWPRKRHNSGGCKVNTLKLEQALRQKSMYSKDGLPHIRMSSYVQGRFLREEDLLGALFLQMFCQRLLGKNIFTVLEFSVGWVIVGPVVAVFSQNMQKSAGARTKAAFEKEWTVNNSPFEGKRKTDKSWEFMEVSCLKETMRAWSCDFHLTNFLLIMKVSWFPHVHPCSRVLRGIFTLQPV